MRMVVLLMVLAACAEPVKMVEPEGIASCGADKVQDLVGQPVGGARGRFAETARIIPPGAAITMDYSAERMNIDLDASGTVIRVWCG